MRISDWSSDVCSSDLIVDIGGFNANIDDPDLQIVRPEHITDYEAGLKADWHIGGMPVRTNVSAFLAKYKDIQRTTSLIFEGLVVTGNFNAAAATLYGKIGRASCRARGCPYV